MRVGTIARSIFSACALAAAGLSLSLPLAVEAAEQKDVQTQRIQRSQLVQLIKAEIVRDLIESGVLREEIRLGIQAYFAEQRSNEEKARNAQRAQAERKAQGVRRVSDTRDHIFGDPTAIISLIEYSDFECPFCKRFHPTPRQLVEKYAGKVNWVYRHFPLSFHNPGAQKQAEAAECAAELGGNAIFWRFVDEIYERTTSNGEGFPLSGLGPLAAELGMNREDFEACVKSARHEQRVVDDFNEGSAAGISGTPGVILLNNRNGKVRLLAGAVSLDVLVAAVSELLEK